MNPGNMRTYPFRRARGRQGANAGQNIYFLVQSQITDLFHILPEPIDGKAILGLYKLGACLDFTGQTQRAEIVRFGKRIGCRP